MQQTEWLAAARSLPGDRPGRLPPIFLHDLMMCSVAVAAAAAAAVVAAEPAAVHAGGRPAWWAAGSLTRPTGAGGWAVHQSPHSPEFRAARCPESPAGKARAAQKALWSPTSHSWLLQPASHIIGIESDLRMISMPPPAACQGGSYTPVCKAKILVRCRACCRCGK